MISSEDIMRVFLPDPSEFFEGPDISAIYRRKLKESKKIGNGQQLIGRNYGYGQYSLYRNIMDNWIKMPIDVRISDRLILDGLHRIACAYDLDKSRLVPVRYI